MFRTVRAFLLAAPAVFVVTLVTFLVSHPRAAETFSPYPFLVQALGQGLMKKPVARFVITAVVFFLVPYLVAGLLLFFADLGVSAAAPIWSRKKSGGDARVPIESRVAFLAGAALLAIWAGMSLHRVAHGGELPGGVNLAPVFVVAASFAVLAGALLVAGLASVPRAVLSRVTGEGA
jgi:phosphoglycerol transferase MdoB-like AlkP superfamily enzyme